MEIKINYYDLTNPLVTGKSFQIRWKPLKTLEISFDFHDTLVQSQLLFLLLKTHFNAFFYGRKVPWKCEGKSATVSPRIFIHFSFLHDGNGSVDRKKLNADWVCRCRSTRRTRWSRRWTWRRWASRRVRRRRPSTACCPAATTTSRCRRSATARSHCPPRPSTAPCRSGRATSPSTGASSAPTPSKCDGRSPKVAVALPFRFVVPANRNWETKSRNFFIKVNHVKP